MTDGRRRRELARADRVVPGVWRLRLPLATLAVPHVNAYLFTAGNGAVLVDCGMSAPGAFAQLERALDQAGGMRIEHVKLLVCTHAHSDHYGMAAPVCDAAGCELWMHPAHNHATKPAADPEGTARRRIEVARHSGVPMSEIERYRSGDRGGWGDGLAAIRMPDRELLDGVEIDSDLGPWRVIETPGHAPSHVVLHQPDRRLLISGDHVLGRPSLFFDYGYTPDPVGEYLTSLEKVRVLDVDLVLAGHGRPVRGFTQLVDSHATLVGEALDRARATLADGPLTAFEAVRPVLQLDGEIPPVALSWSMSMTLAYLTRLERTGEAERFDDEDGTERWRLASPDRSVAGSRVDDR